MNLPITPTSIALLLGLVCADLTSQRRRYEPPNVELKHLVYKSGKFDSAALKEETAFSVFLPKDYDAEANKEKRYPLILFLHGMWEDHQRFYGRGGAKVLDQLVGDGTLPPTVFVCAHDRSRGSFYINGKQRKVEAMLLEDLLPHIDKNYRTKKGRDHRALLGVSMGGFGALKIAFKNPKAFGIVATHSAAILPEKSEELVKVFPWAAGRADRFITPIFGKPIDEKLWGAENPLTIARALDPKHLAGLQIYFDCGDADRYGFHGPNVDLHEVLKKRKIKHVWRTVKGGTHGWNTRRAPVGYNQTALPHSLRFIAKSWARKKGAAGLGGLLGGDAPAKQGDGNKK